MKTLREKVIDELNGKKKHMSNMAAVSGVLFLIVSVIIAIVYHYREAIDSKSHVVEVILLLVLLIVFGWWALIERKK